MLGQFKQSFLKTGAYLTISFLLTSCAGLSAILGAAEESASSGSNQATDAGAADATGTDSSIPDSDSPSDTGVPEAPEALPQSFIPSELIAYSSDSEENVPVVASAGAVSCTDCQVVVSASTITAANSLLPREKVAAGRMRGLFTLSLIPTAYADTGSDICSQPGITCCPVEADGSFQCYAELTDQSVAEVHLAIVSSDGSVGEDITETVHSNLKWLASAPQDVATLADGTIYAITNDMAVKLSENSAGNTLVQGDHTIGYESFATTGTKLSYSATDALLGAMGTTGIQLYNVDGSAVTDSGETGCAATSTATPAVMKTLSNTIFCGRTESVAVDEASLEYVTTSAKYDERRHHNIKIIAPEDGLSLVQVLGFDQKEIFSNYWTVVTFSDGENVRIRAIYKDGNTSRLDGGVWKSLGDVTIKDLVFYHAQADSSEDSRFAILDSQNNKVWLGKVNVSTGVLGMSDANIVSVGNNPVAMKLYGDKLFVLNAGDQSISVIHLFNTNGTTPRETPFVSATVSLPDFITGKTLTLTPSTFIVNADQLIVGDTTTKALLVVDRSAITETSLADEAASSTTEATTTETTTTTVDADGDGYDSTTDCDDNAATINPAATEVCSDSLDNDCDGTVDEGCSRGSGRGGR